MSNKLHDDDQHSFSKKSMAALTTGLVGAALFYKNGGQRLLAEGVPKLGKLLSSVSDDLYNMKLKDYTYDNIDGIVKKHFTSDNSTLKTLTKDLPPKIELKTTGKSLASTLINIEEIKANPESIVRKVFNGEYKEQVSKTLRERYKITNQSFSEQIDSLIRDSIDKNNLISYINENDEIMLNNEMIESYIDPKMLGKNKNNFFKDLLESVDNMEDAFDDYKDFHYNSETESYDLIDNMINSLTKEDFAKTLGTSDSEGLGTLLNGKSVTLKDYIDNLDKFADQKLTIGNKEINLKDLLTNFAEEYNANDILLDPENLKFDSNNQIIDLREFNNYKEKALKGISGTIPGKLLKTTDKLSTNDVSNINIIQKGTAAGLLSGIDGNTKRLNNSYMQMLNKIYRIGNDDSLSYIKELNESEDLYARSSSHGSIPRQFTSMFGLNSEREVSNKFMKFFDIGTTGNKFFVDKLSEDDGVLGKLSRKLTGAKQYNVIDRLTDMNYAMTNPIEYRKAVSSLNSIYSNITKVPKVSDIKKVANSLQNQRGKDILNIVSQDNIENILTDLSAFGNFENQDLATLINSSLKNRNRAARTISIKSDKLTNSKEIFNRLDMIRREAFKEAMLNEAVINSSRTSNFNLINNAIKKSGLNKEAEQNANRLSHWAVIQSMSKTYNNRNDEFLLEEINRRNLKILDLLTSSRTNGSITKNVSFVTQLAEDVRSIKDSYKELTNKTIINNKDRIKHGIKYDEIMLSRKTYTLKRLVLDSIKDINDTTKLKANIKKYGMQYVAGRNTPQFITDKTFTPYFLTERLTQPFNKYGLGFSNKNLGNITDIWKAIFTKRVAPIALGATAFSYLNFETKNLTGTSITGAMAQGVANVDLGLRKIADATGIGYILEAERQLNPISQYWLGDDYQDSRERKDYYENGYDEVRKSRWWAFGSASEFRGGKISYFQPNYVKRAISDWKDEGLYGGSNEKWKHSWIPTPRHPLSPIRRALDPYWLERKHYYDRPYMTTAPLFSSGTPWGAILNPTVGEIIKPVRRMHREETRRGLTDPRTLIAERNEIIKAKAIDKNNENLFKLSMDGISNITFTPTALADSNKAIVSLKIGNRGIQSINYNGVGYSENVEEVNNGVIIQDNSQQQVANPSRQTILNRLETTAIGSGISNSLRSYLSPLDIIQANNNAIKVRATKGDGVKLQKANLAQLSAKVAAERINTRQDEADLLLTTSKYNYINDALFSSKQLGGIWGFINEKVFGSSKRKVRAESANNMVSFTRTFWDSNIGGLGGGVMEIARRFFPHQDRSWREVNRIRNTMPDWMPNRFKVGRNGLPTIKCTN